MVHVTEKANILDNNSGFQSTTLTTSESTNRVKLYINSSLY